MKREIIIASSIMFLSQICCAGKYTIPPIEQSLIKFETNSPKEKLKNNFSLLVWNVHKGADGQSWVNDMKILAQNADVFLVQEAMDDELMTDMYQKEINNFDWFFAKSFTYNKSGNSSGVVNASPFQTDQAILYRTLEKEPIVGTPKTVMLSFMTMENGNPIALLNIHGLNRTKNEAFFKQISDTLDLIKNFSGPVVYAGDFNTNNKEKFSGLDSMMAKVGLRRFKFQEDHRKHQLDWIYVRGCRVESSDILYQFQTSDHTPISAKLNCQ
jgi:endonuclease/exonuclease/phosphatase (EEP) superfamily protein YafD